MHAQTTWHDPSPAFGTLSPLRGARGARGECVSRPFAPRKRGEGARSADEGPSSNAQNVQIRLRDSGWLVAKVTFGTSCARHEKRTAMKNLLAAAIVFAGCAT